MDKKRTIKTVLAACFVIACGTLYLVCCSPFSKRDEVVFEKRPDTPLPVTGTGEGDVTPSLREETIRDSGEDHGENGTVGEEPVTMLYVHICGAVSKEGVYTLPVGSRVTDGIEAAGGFCEDADVTFHNLAALLKDGQKIYVPTREETEALSLQERAEAGDGSLPGTEGSYGTGAEKKVNLNTAGLAELMTLTGIGEAKAESILKYREKVGNFQSVEELMKVSGIGEAMFERIRDDIVVE